jgi:hypothetical protein
MTKRKQKWVLVLEHRTIIGDCSCAVGPFDSEEQARAYANSKACDPDEGAGMHTMLLLRPDPAPKVRSPGKIR